VVEGVSVKYGLLGILARKAQHGYELKRSFEQLTGGFWELNYGQIYQTLDRLESEGYVTYSVAHEGSAPDKKVYAITEAGRSALGAWLAQPEVRPRPLRDELFIRLAVMPDSDVPGMLELLSAHGRIYLEKMRELTRAKAALRAESGQDGHGVRVEELLIDAALYHAEADLRWLEHCEAKLRGSVRGKLN
jgi:DNA-binding PadR family transcriptional regulator